MTRQKGRGPQRRWAPPPSPSPSPSSSPSSRSGKGKPPRPTKWKGATEEEVRRRRRLATVGIVFFATTGIAAAVWGRTDKNDVKREIMQKAVAGGTCKLDDRYDKGSDHIAGPEYTANPPAGGDHTPKYTSAGVYEPGSVPTDGELVHAQEHGFVVLWYRPDSPAKDLAGLRSVVDGDPDATVMVPREGLPVPVAATAWHHRMLCADGFARAAFTKFVEVWRDQGPEKGFVAGG